MFPLWNFFLERRAFTILLMASLVLSGLAAIAALPKESSPEVVLPMGIVSTALPGATAADIEQLITDKLEPAIQNIPNIDKVTSNSQQGASVITAQFVASADIETAIQDLRNAVEGAKRDLPSDAIGPTVVKIDFQDQPVLMIGVSSDLAPETLHKLGEDLKNDLLTLPGVSKVDVTGVRNREVSVIVDPQSLAAYGISAGSIIGALQTANASAPAGTLTIDNVHYPVQVNGDIKNAEEIGRIPVRTMSGEVRLSNLAAVVDGFEETGTISRLAQNGSASYAMTLNVYKSGKGNVLEVSQVVRERLSELESSLLLGSDYMVVYDSGEEVQVIISDLIRAGRDTILLILLVLFVAVGFREAIVSALSIPFSFMIAFLGMWATGNTINFVSLFALIIAIGILVDSGIVIVEGIHTNREKGMDKMTAARAAVRQFAWPLIAGTMTTVAIFIPLFFLSGIMGQFLFSIPFTIVTVLLASLVVALGFVPLIAMGLMRREDSRFAKRRERLWRETTAWYKVRLEQLFERRRLQLWFFGFLIASFIFALALPVSGLLKSVMFPPADMDFFYVEIELPQASVLAQTDAATRAVEKIIADIPELDSYLATVGAGSAFNWEPGAGSKVANITVNLDKERERTSIAIANELRTAILPLQGQDGAKITVFETAGGPPTGAPVVVKIWSDDAAALAAATAQVESIVENTAGARDIASTLASDGTEIAVNIDRERAGRYGLSAADVAFAIRTAVAGVEATKVRIDGNDLSVRVMLSLNPDYVQPGDVSVADTDALANVPVSTAQGIIPLGSLIAIEAGRSAASIAHEDGKRIGTVSAYVEEGANAVEVTAAVREMIDASDMPDGVSFTYGGDDEEIQRTFTEMLIALVAGLVLMFAVLVLEFNAFRTTLRLLLAIPLSLTGVLIGLFVMGEPLSLTAFLGIIALAGVIINHGILLLDRLNRIQEENPGSSPREIVLGAATSRLRPILLTTVTTVVGMIPLTMVSDMWAPLAYTIAFGLIYGTILTLILIPLLSYRHLSKAADRR